MRNKFLATQWASGDACNPLFVFNKNTPGMEPFDFFNMNITREPPNLATIKDQGIVHALQTLQGPDCANLQEILMAGKALCKFCKMDIHQSIHCPKWFCKGCGKTAPGHKTCKGKGKKATISQWAPSLSPVSIPGPSRACQTTRGRPRNPTPYTCNRTQNNAQAFSSRQVQDDFYDNRDYDLPDDTIANMTGEPYGY
ncbi:hypothetical protein CVT24_001018 [Panaeolus cyanescens]|uniref:Uncharacterized protein n=1 Tax=Panaeolus cyanescens TaxID=181874 RepID=A0A409YYD8_9AGAR|nr:hypothetical protein CVT24_001018 [Panaeolus cyanescens]